MIKREESSHLGLVGCGLGHSLSKLIHEYSLDQLHLKGAYDLYEIKSEQQVKKFMRDFWDQGGSGLNMTAPYKIFAADLFQIPNLPSINTLYRREDSSYWSATSTDGEGFLRGLQRMGCDPSLLQHVVFLGAGGATLALAKSFNALKKNNISILCRSPLSARVMYEMNLVRCSFFPLSLENFKRVLGLDNAQMNNERPICSQEQTLVVQATPVRDENLGLFAENLFRFRGYVSDLLYGPSVFYEKVSKGLSVSQDGLSMLIEQALLAQKIWWGRCCDFHEVKEFLNVCFRKTN
ncbi:MAG: hypothetical protein KA436_03165 [Oligoflexales bacterium]|nr:hypothetical protein [Oligoflexales bacterium]